jgi:hypothetical protein
MPKRTVITVGAAGEGGWQGTAQGGAAGKTHRTKPEALKAAVRQAKATDLGLVRIKGRDGRIQSERTYGADPRRYRG